MRVTASRPLLLVVMLLLVAGCGENVHEDELDDLVLADATLMPAFDPDVLEYTAEVANAVASTTVTAEPHDNDATIAVNGTPVEAGVPSAPIDLMVGETTIDVVVTDDDGDTQTYTVVVTRAGPPGTSAALDALELTAADLDQVFDPSLTEYDASAGYLAAATRVIAVPEDEGAEITLAGKPIAGGEPSAPVPLPVGDTTLELEVTAEDGSETRTYAVQVSRASRASVGQEAYLKPSNTGPDVFGSSTAIFADTIAIGAPEESSAASGVDGNELDNSLGDAGAAYVFRRHAATWVQEAYLKAGSPGADDRFGGAVAVQGDVLVVGSEGEESLASGIDGDENDDSSFRVGAVYAFVRDGMGVWSREAYLKASNAGRGDEFGRALSLDGSRLVVGAWSEDSGATGVDGDADSDSQPGAGAAYVFERDDAGSWREVAYLKASNTDSGDEFGRAVALSGGTAAAGAPGEDADVTGIDGDGADDSVTSAGAVYVFDEDTAGDWTQGAYVKASNTDPGDAFGSTVALDGDLLAVGAPGEDGGDPGIDGDEQDDSLQDAGAVYLFERDDGEWSQVAYVKASNPDAGDEFGSALALAGNVLVVAAPRENAFASGLDGDEIDDNAPDAGAVYVFARADSGAWQQIAYVKPSNPDPGDEFGSALAFYGDTLVIGAPFEDSADTGVDGDDADDSLTDAGAAYVIR